MISRRQEFINIVVIALIPLILILHNLNYYKSLLLYDDSYRLFSIYLIAPIIFYFLLKLFRFHSTIAALITIIVSILFFFFGAMQDLFLSYSFTYYLSKTYVLLFLFLLLIIFLFTKRPIGNKLLRFITIITSCFLLTEIIFLVFNLSSFNETPNPKEDVVLNTTTKAPDSLNIYHIILDGYTNSKTLQEQFGFANTLDSFLQQNGFFVAKHTKSNYNFTPYSLASTLHLQYLDISGKQLERNYKNYFLGAELYPNNPVFVFFSERGYKGQSFSILEDYEHLDKLGTFVPKTPVYSVRNQTVERIFLNPWLWKKFSASNDMALPTEIKNSLQYYADYNRKAYENVLTTSTKTKVYNFSHFLLPHEPYVFTKNTIDSLTEGDIMDHQYGYPKQLQYINKLIETMVEELRKNKNNIIIIQGDHGFRDYDFSKTPALAQFETFNAFYFPDRNYSSLSDSISLVNTYRLVLSQYFQQNLPLLKDQYFIPPK